MKWLKKAVNKVGGFVAKTLGAEGDRNSLSWLDAIVPGSTLAIGTGLDIWGESSARQHQKDMAGDQMAFQERMSSSAHQRSVADLKAAGINPMAAYASGGSGGASTPMGSTGGSATSAISNSAGKIKDLAGIGIAQEGLNQKKKYENAQIKIARKVGDEKVAGAKLQNEMLANDLIVQQYQLPERLAEAQWQRENNPNLREWDKYLNRFKKVVGPISQGVGTGLGLRYGMKGMKLGKGVKPSAGVRKVRSLNSSSAKKRIQKNRASGTRKSYYDKLKKKTRSKKKSGLLKTFKKYHHKG